MLNPHFPRIIEKLLKNFTTRLEITFWDVAITLLSRSRLMQMLTKWAYRKLERLRLSGNMLITSLFLAFFVMFLFTGLWAGMHLSRSKAAAGQLVGLIPVEVEPTPVNGQLNVLVIGVDQLSAPHPRLESVWLSAHLPGVSRLTLVPLYPPAPESGSPALSTLGRIFTISPHGQPGESALDLLRRERIWWNGYIMVDWAGTVEILDFLGGVRVSDLHQDGALAIYELPHPWEDPASALKGQTDLLRGLCQKTKHFPSRADYRPILNLIPDHLRTDLDYFQVIQDWQALVEAKGGLECDFPLLEASLP